MSDLTRYANGTRQSITVDLALGATGAPAVGLTPATVTAAYYRHPAVAIAAPLVALATVTSAHVARGFKEIDAALMPGLYRVDLDDAMTIGGAPDVVLVFKGATIATRTVVVALVPSPPAAMTHKYRLKDSFADDFRGPALVGTAARLSEAGYSFELDTYPLSLSNVLTGDVYSLVVRFQFVPPAPVANYQKLVDFKNRIPDDGLYCSAADGLDWGAPPGFPYIDGAPDVLGGLNVPHIVVLTRDAAGTVCGYVDGALQWTTDDSVSRAAVATAPQNVVYFLTDDIGGIDQTRPRTLDYVATYNYPLSATDVAALVINRDAPVLPTVNLGTINGAFINGSGVEGDEFQP